MPGGGTSFRATASLVPKTAGPHVLSLVQLGPTRVLLDGALVLDGVTDPPPRGRELFAMGSEAIEATVELDTSPHELVVEYTGGTSGPLEGVQVGCRALPPADLMDRAVAAAAGADATIVVVGTNDDWESEGHDREFMELPGDQAELIRRVAAANPRTVVAVNAASPGDDGLGGRGAGGARDLVRRPGDGERARRRSVRRERTERAAAHHVPGPARAQPVVRQLSRRERAGALRRRRVRRVPVVRGARVARRVPVRPRLVVHHVRDRRATRVGYHVQSAGDTLTVEVDVTNTGARRGAEVVQCYVAPRDPSVTRPAKELKAFAKVWLDPGETTTVTLELDDRAFSYWQPAVDEPPPGRTGPPIPSAEPPPAPDPGWRVDAGSYDLHIGRSSAAAEPVATIRVTGEVA